MAYSNLSQLAMLNDDPDGALTHGKSAIAIGQVLGRPDIMSHALNNMGAIRIWVDPDQGRRDLDRSLELALEHNFQEHAARTYTNRGCFEIYALDYPAARSVLERGIAYCIDHDIDTWHYYMQGWLAEVLLRQGHWIDAAEHALPIVADENATTLMRYTAQLALARMRLRRGDPGFDPLREEIERFLATGLELQRLAPYATLMAERAWVGLGDRNEALRLLQQAERLTPNRVVFAELIAWRRRLRPDAPLGDIGGVPEPYADEFTGDWAGAAEKWRAIGAPFEQALALLDGDETAQRTALQIFEDLGAKPVAEKARALMRRRGIDNIARGPRESTRTNALGLTRRQMQILALLGRGLSSKRIAAEFAISPKTVDHHVAAVLEKLGAHTRGEALVAAREKGLV
jgi:DNA-binding CsgD family transcriptional regulator